MGKLLSRALTPRADIQQRLDDSQDVLEPVGHFSGEQLLPF
jgi:hypothetical protein